MLNKNKIYYDKFFINIDDKAKFLQKIKPDFYIDDSLKNCDSVEKMFRETLSAGEGIQCDVLLSEEGGRFFHEQNRNVMIDIGDRILEPLPEDYLWVDYGTLNYLVQVNNCLNIQLRNLLSLMKL